MSLDLSKIPATPTVPFNVLEVEDGFNIRTEYDATKISALADSIAEHGQNTPIKVKRNGGSKLIVVEGHRRFLAMQKLGWKNQPVKIDLAEFDKATEAYLSNLVENENREPVSDHDLGKRAHELSVGIQPLGPSGEPEGELIKVPLSEIAKRTSKSLSHIQNLVRCYKNLSEDSRRVWANGFVAGKKRQKLPINVVFELGKAEDGSARDEEEQEKILGEFIAKTEATLERTGGKKPRRTKKELEAAAAERPASKSEMLDALETLENRRKDDDAPKKGSVADAFLAGQINALRYTTSEITLRGMLASAYK